MLIPKVPLELLNERSIRPFTVGRNNWFQIDTVSGAKASAIAYSIAETAKANRLKTYEYFCYLLEELPRHGELEELTYVEQLLPWSETLPECCYQKNIHQRIRFVPICRLQKAALILAGTDYGAFTERVGKTQFLFEELKSIIFCICNVRAFF